MVNLGLPASLQRVDDPPASDARDDIVEMSQRELDARLEAAHKLAFEEGLAKGREIALDQANEEVLAQRKSLAAKLDAAEALIEKLETAIRAIADEADRVQSRVEDAANAAASKMALKLLFELESSEDMLASVVANIVEDFSPTSVRVHVHGKLVDRIAGRFADDDTITVSATADGEPLSVRFDTEGGRFEYSIESAFDQLKRMIDQRSGGSS